MEALLPVAMSVPLACDQSRTSHAALPVRRDAVKGLLEELELEWLELEEKKQA